MGASATADRAYKHVDGLGAVKRSGYSLKQPYPFGLNPLSRTNSGFVAPATGQPAMAHVHVGLPILACALTVSSR